MAVNLKDIDPAVVQDKAKQPAPQPAPKKDIPVSSFVVSSATNDEDDPILKQNVDHGSMCFVSTIDSKVIAVPRAVAAKMPVVAPVLADQAADDHSPIPIDTSANAAIAVAHWIEYTGSASGKTETAMPDQVLYTDMNAFLLTDWEKDFDHRILTRDSETLLRVTNFAERNGMSGLLDFCVVALSCAIRGKSNHEVMVALCCDGEEMADEDIQAGTGAYPWIKDLTKPHGDDE